MLQLFSCPRVSFVIKCSCYSYFSIFHPVFSVFSVYSELYVLIFNFSLASVYINPVRVVFSEYDCLLHAILPSPCLLHVYFS